MNIRNLFQTIDTQVLGEAFRMVIHSPIHFHTNSILEKQDELQNNFTKEKQLLINEPRGHRGMNGCIIHPSIHSGYELLFFNHAKSSSFKYEALLASLSALLETGNINQTEDENYSVMTSHGEYRLQAKMHNHQIISCSIAVKKARRIKLEDSYSIYTQDDKRNYLITSLPEDIPAIDLVHLGAIETWGATILEQKPYKGGDLEGIILIERLAKNHFKTVTFEKDGFIRRTPGIDSTSVLVEAYKEEINTDMPVKNETIFGSILHALPHPNQNVFETRPFLTGSQEFLLDANDPLPTGFLLR